MTPGKKTLTLMEKSPLFQDLNAADLELLLTVAEEEVYNPEATIVAEGARGDAIFVILEGSVDIVKAGKKGPVTLVTLGPKDFFGEMSLIDQEPRSASAVGAAKTTVLRFASDQICALLEGKSRILSLLITRIARNLSQRLRMADEQILALIEAGE